MTFLQLVVVSLIHAVSTWGALTYIIRTVNRALLFAPKLRERVAGPLDAALQTETATPGKLTRAQLLFYIREARKELVRAGAKPLEALDAAKLLKEPVERSELDGVRRALETDKLFAPLIAARDALSDSVVPDDAGSLQALLVGVVAVLDTIARALLHVRYQGAEPEHQLAEKLIQVAAALDGLLHDGGGDEPTQA